jgi:protein subunit release factor B
MLSIQPLPTLLGRMDYTSPMSSFPIDLPPDIAAIAAEVKVDPGDIEEHFVRGSGPGGQKINKTNSPCS